MKLTKTINFADVEGLTRTLLTQRPSARRFRLEVDVNDAAKGLYSAFKASVLQRGGAFEFDDSTREHILKAAKWMTEEDGKTGLMLCGLFGNGKTTLAKAIAAFIYFVTEHELGYSKRKVMKMLTAKEISLMCAAGARFKDSRDDYEELFSAEMLCIDELGGEPAEVMVYSMPQTPIIDILSHRYDKQLMTVVTTNLNPEQLREKYGERLYDRFREMFQVVVFENPSYRK